MADKDKHARLTALVAAVQAGLATKQQRTRLLAALEPYALGPESLKLARKVPIILGRTATAVQRYLAGVVDGRPEGLLRSYPLRDMVLLRLAADLGRDAQERLCRCARCRLIFYRRRRNTTYCSRRCAVKAAAARYAARG
jgi:hypothetical protein